MKAKILVGLPASGKTTYRYMNINSGWVWLSTDDIIERICEDYDTAYSDCFGDLIGFAQKVFDRDIESSIDKGLDVVIDRTNLSRKVRKPFIDKLKKAGYHTEEKEWNRRLNSRPGKTIPDDVIRSMMSRFEMPTTNEGFDEVTVLE